MATTTTTTSLTSDPTANNDGPVLTVITKRLRALRKKLNRITQMELSLSQGKSLNNEQLDVLRSKPSVLALIDELEKLRSPLSAAVLEEISTVKSTSPSNGNNDATDDVTLDEIVKDFVNLMYFGNLFDVRPQGEFTSLMLTRTHERGCCLTYDYVTDDDDDNGGGLLGEKDLDLISELRELMVSKPVHSVLSHRSALEKCVRHAKLWLDKSDSPIGDSDSNVTYAGLREKLNKIMASDYFTATPQVKGPGEVAAAAAVGNFGSFEVSLHEPVMAVEVPVQVEGSAEQYQETEENVGNDEQYEAGEDHSNAVQEFHKDDLEPENPPEVVSAEADQEQFEAEIEGQRTTDIEEQQYVPRRGGQRGGRGGGGGRRGGYPNGRGGRGSGRGGGPYQNGRGQYYDNYYPRNNYYNNRRGGRGGGGGGGGNSYHNQGNFNRTNVGVES